MIPKRPEKKECILEQSEWDRNYNKRTKARNDTIDEFERFLPSKEELEDIILECHRDADGEHTYTPTGFEISKAISKRLRNRGE